MNNKKIIVMGNGPSLKSIDLKSLSSIDTIGMNAAYRYWDRIDWYPTHYVCLDDQLIETHASAINDMIVRGKVRTAFLISKILDYYPELISHPKVFFLESFHATRQKRVEERGIPFIPAIPFRESDASKVTTGSYSVRFAAFLGYKDISILGIDLQYVEVIDEAKSTEGIKLEMVTTPKSNPNYFFDDYQRAGDKYNIPNPDAHDGNLHVKSFEVMVNDIKQFNWNSNVYNSNICSILEDNKILPFMPLSEFNPDTTPSNNYRKDKKLFVAGNGPSLKDINFDNLKTIDWLGMNAAYRYWDEIGVYPTIYCCLDRVVVKAHAKEILRLISEGNTQHFFLVKDVLEVVPELEYCPQVYFLEDLCALETDSAKIFKTNFPDKITTGSWALRFSIFLGYQKLYLAGIDCNYTELVEGAEHTGKHNELIIKSGIKSNPNYFFNSYQQEGDLYQVPNPSRHFGNLHLQSFEALNIDIEKHVINVDIFNLASSSQLHKLGIYPLVSPNLAFDLPDLQAISVPLTKGELPQLLKNIKLLDLPAFLPLRSGSNLEGKIYFHIFFDCDYSKDVEQELVNAWSNTRFLQYQFKELRITFLDIPSDINLYARNRPDANFSTKSGPNVHFFSLVNMCREYSNVFLMECDCVPTRGDWLADLNGYCHGNKEFWIAGSFISELGTVDPAIASHINGNAIYATGNDSFIDFIENVMKPALFYFVYEAKSVHLAYDCLLAKIQSYGTAFRLRRNNKKASDNELMKYFHLIQKNLHRFSHTEVIKNISHIENEFTNAELIGYLDSVHTIIHSKNLTNLLVEQNENYTLKGNSTVLSLSLKRQFQDTYLRVANEQPLVTHSYCNMSGLNFSRLDRSNACALLTAKNISAGKDESDSHGAYIIFKMDDLDKDDKVSCEIKVKSSVSQQFLIKFGRDGSGIYVEDKALVAVVANEEYKLSLSFLCKDKYEKLRLFVKPKNGKASDIKINFNVFKHKPKVNSNRCIALVDVDESTKTIQKEFQVQGQRLKSSVEDQLKVELVQNTNTNKVVPKLSEESKPNKNNVNKKQVTLKNYTPNISEVVDALAEEDHNKLDSLLKGVRDSYLPSLFKALSKSPKYKWLLPTLETYSQDSEGEYNVPQVVYIDPVHRNTVSATQELRKRLLQRYPSAKVTLIHPSWSKKGFWELTVDKKTEILSIQEVIASINGVSNARVLVRTGFLGETGVQLYTNLLKVKHKIIALVMDTWDIRLKNDTSDIAKSLMNSFITLLDKTYTTMSITEDMANYMVQNYSVINGGVIHNFIPQAQFERMQSKQLSHERHGSNKKLTYLYSGGLEEDMTYGGLLDFIKVVASNDNLKKHVKLIVKTFKRHESQAKKIIEECKKYGVSHSVISKDLSKAEYNQVVADADVYFIPYVDSKSSSEYVLYSYPNKFSDYLETQKPIVYFGPNYAICRIIGLLDVEGIYSVNSSEKLQELIEHIDKNYDNLCQNLKDEVAKIISNFGEEKILTNFYAEVI
jgi:hypothetical protein